MPALVISHLSKHYGELVALDDVSLTIHEGEFFGLLGPNGAGKTTLISIVAGLSRPTLGSVMVMGYDVIKTYQQARRQLGVVPQELAFDPFFTVRETLRMQQGYFGLKRDDDWIDEIITHLGLFDKADVNMRLLSGGMKRRVLVAQSLVHKPPVVILDEPTAGVDVELRQTLWQFIGRLNQSGTTIILTTHYLEEAEVLCSRIAMLKAGRVIALDTTQALLGHMKGEGSHLVLRLSGASLPDSLHHRIMEKQADKLILRIEKNSEIEIILATLREAGCIIEDLSLQQADLEDVFLRMMGRK